MPRSKKRVYGKLTCDDFNSSDEIRLEIQSLRWVCKDKVQAEKERAERERIEAAARNYEALMELVKKDPQLMEKFSIALNTQLAPETSQSATVNM